MCSLFIHIFQFAENRCIELHSPDGVHSCLLRASDPQEGSAWFNALHSAIARSTQRALADANRALSNIIGELKHIGWLSRRANEQVLYLSIIHIFPYVDVGSRKEKDDHEKEEYARRSFTACFVSLHSSEAHSRKSKKPNY